jgi:hypothetical protein
MTTKSIRPLDVVMKDLTDAANDIEVKKKKLEELNLAQSKASTELDNAQVKAGQLRNEMEEYLNLLVPRSVQDRIRQTA